jgi:hypothetical protein
MNDNYMIKMMKLRTDTQVVLTYFIYQLAEGVPKYSSDYKQIRRIS